MTTQQSLEAKRKEALEKLQSITPRNPPVIGIHCTRWPMMERCHPTTREAIQAIKNAMN